ncbi:MmcQ/YjbR family DNA-binding protein [Caulobacter sp. RL271]|uniref:MmcQ/YjbR family DNA-binding protein n=1 Tax=Caulobacter segnis TaxID=88688 RepID=A0ABY4ZST7_9CAUL|nr:MmcQ/YjbR family DNA-binding protein [Caulobacter segnis]USQ95264.1 MmcQ/YjbR family DNA-binding protein [Caulobacter segnis]
MTPEVFSTLAVRAGHGVVTYPILDTVQYRFGGKAFATLGWPAAGWAVVKLYRRDRDWALSLSEGLAPEPGGRRRAGIVLVRLAAVEDDVVELVLSAAWRHAAQRKSSAAKSIRIVERQVTGGAGTAA